MKNQKYIGKRKAKQPVKIEPTEPVVKIKSQFIMHASYDRFRMITVYSDYTISVGSEQELKARPVMELAVRP